MESFLTLVKILVPMLVGFCICVPKRCLLVLDRFLNFLVYFVLFLIGVSLSRVDNLWSQLNGILVYVLVLFALLMVFNILALVLFDWYQPWRVNVRQENVRQKMSFWLGLKQPVVVLFGLLFGLMLPESFVLPEQASLYVVMLLIFVVGIQLRSNGIPLRQVLLNIRGMQISVVFVLSCMLAGLLFSCCFDEVTWQQGLALSSGFGWYSLSGIVMTQAYGPTWGSVALLNDLLREFFALAWISVLMRRSPSAGVGIGGATSLDFTLPVIQSAGGLEVVAPAISFGFVVNLVAPVLMLVFSAYS